MMSAVKDAGVNNVNPHGQRYHRRRDNNNERRIPYLPLEVTCSSNSSKDDHLYDHDYDHDHDGQDDRELMNKAHARIENGRDDHSTSNNNKASQLYLCNSLVFVIGSIFYVAMGCLPYSGLYYNKNNNNNNKYNTTNVTTTIVTMSDNNITDNSINDIDCDDNDDKYEEIVYSIFYVIASLSFVATGLLELVALRMEQNQFVELELTTPVELITPIQSMESSLECNVKSTNIIMEDAQHTQQMMTTILILPPSRQQALTHISTQQPRQGEIIENGNNGSNQSSDRCEQQQRLCEQQQEYENEYKVKDEDEGIGVHHYCFASSLFWSSLSSSLSSLLSTNNNISNKCTCTDEMMAYLMVFAALFGFTSAIVMILGYSAVSEKMNSISVHLFFIEGVGMLYTRITSSASTSTSTSATVVSAAERAAISSNGNDNASNINGYGLGDSKEKDNNDEGSSNGIFQNDESVSSSSSSSLSTQYTTNDIQFWILLCADVFFFLGCFSDVGTSYLYYYSTTTRGLMDRIGPDSVDDASSVSLSTATATATAITPTGVVNSMINGNTTDDWTHPEVYCANYLQHTQQVAIADLMGCIFWLVCSLLYCGVSVYEYRQEQQQQREYQHISTTHKQSCQLIDHDLDQEDVALHSPGGAG